MTSILTNPGAMTALQTLRGINKELGSVQDQISTGKKVANAVDNASVFSISSVMKSDVAGFRGISESLSLGQSTVAVARSAAESVKDLLVEIKGRVVASQEANVDRDVIQADIEQLRGQVESVVGAAQFNGLNLLQDLSGENDMRVLASLDRANDGSVTASSITAQTQDLQTTAHVIGADGDHGIGSVTGDAAADSTETIDLDGSVAAVSVGDSFEFSFDDTNGDSHAVAVVAKEGDDINDIANRLKTALDNLGLQDQNITFTVTEAADVTADTATVNIINANAAGSGLDLANSTFTGESGGTAGGGLEELANIDVSTEAGSRSGLRNIETLINTAIDAASAFGQVQSRLGIQNDFVSSLTDNLNAGIGALVDADMEEASARLQSLQVQQQLGIQAFSIANQAPNNILALFR